MEGEEKKFNTVEIVLMMMIALANDALTIIADIGLAIPVIGEILYGLTWLVDGFVWALFMFWYIMKLGVFGGPALVQTISGIASFIGIPGRTIGVILGIWLANHPKAAAVAALATGKVGGAEKAAGKEIAAGEGAVAEGKATAALTEQEGAHLERLRETGYAGLTEEGYRDWKEKGYFGESERVTGKPIETPAGKPSEVSTERKPAELPEAKKPEVSKEALGEELTPLEKLQKLFEETPRAEEKSKDEDEEENEEEFQKAA